MVRRALLKFRNPDSTQDLNDRFKNLFNKGFFSGGALSIPGGSLKVDLAPFATAGSDGMFVREDSETTRLDVVAGFKNYIVIRQEYISNAAPVVSIESLLEGEFNSDGPIGAKGANNPTLIVFGVVNVPADAVETLTGMIETFESDIVDTIGRSSFRGLLSEEMDLPVGVNGNRAGDFFIVTDGLGVASSFPSIHAWNGADWINITNAQDTLNLLDAHRQNQNEDENHLTDEQYEAAAGSIEGATGAFAPNDDNRYVVELDPRLLSLDQADAAEGNGLDLEDFLPSDTNRFITSSKVFAVPTEIVVDAGTPSPAQTLNSNFIELPVVHGGYFVGVGAEAVTGTAHQWFNIYAEDTAADEEYVNTTDFNAVKVTEVRIGPPGLFNIQLLIQTTPINPQTDTDDLGFYVHPTNSVYLVTTHQIQSPVRVSYGKRGSIGTLLPHLLMNRGPKGGQLDTRLVRLLFGTPNAQFEDPAIWEDISFLPAGSVVAYNAATFTFVKADPNPGSGLDPVGIRGNFNNLIMEGLYTRTNGSYTTIDRLYADKANPGSLTNLENEWFIGRAISTTQLLVNMSGIAGFSTEPSTPVQFPVGLFLSGLQAGETTCFKDGKFEAADRSDPDRLPLGIRGNNNNVIQSGKYTALANAPFVEGTRYYAGVTAGTLTSVENDWFIGIGIDSTTLLVNANAVAIPSKWSEEHQFETGFHNFKYGDIAERDAIQSPADGMVFFRDDTLNSIIEYYNEGLGEWVAASQERTDIPSGSKMLFIQDTVPTGWTLDVTANDRVIRVTAILGEGGDAAGSWTITDLVADPHMLSVEEMPSHDHDIHGGKSGDNSPEYNFNGPDGSNNPADSNSGRPTELAGEGEAHAHTVSSGGLWRPSYINAIICIRD